jgi:hypothetical protein
MFVPGISIVLFFLFLPTKAHTHAYIYIYIYIYIQGVLGGIVNILGGGSMDYSE